MRKVMYGMPKHIKEGAGMPIKLNGRTYYRTVEVCQMVGISRNTLFRWLKKGILGKTTHRDRRGWRLFTEGQIEKLKTEVNHISQE